MALDIPQLGQKEFKEISKELINTIPRYTKNWTNFNPSDPGVILLEAFAYIADNLFYTMNRLPEVSYLHYLRRIAGVVDLEQINQQLDDLSFAGPEVDQAQVDFLEYVKTVEERYANGQLSYDDIPEMKGKVLTFLQSRFRAVTEEDYHALLLEVPSPEEEGGKIARSFLEVGTDQYSRTVLTILADQVRPYTPMIFEPIKTSELDNPHFPIPHPIEENAIPNIEVFPRGFSYRIDPADLPAFNGIDFTVRSNFTGHNPVPASITDYNYRPLIYNTIDYMEPRRLVGSRLEVIEPTFTQIEIDMMISCPSPFIAQKTAVKVAQKFQEYLDPIKGGPDGTGWPYQRPFSVHEAYHILESMDEIGAVHHFTINGQSELDKVETFCLFDLTKISIQTRES